MISDPEMIYCIIAYLLLNWKGPMLAAAYQETPADVHTRRFQSKVVFDGSRAEPHGCCCSGG
jgi:hypothetical protein